MEPFAACDGPVRVVVAVGQGLLRAGLRLLLESEDGIAVTAEAATVEEGVSAARATGADVVLMDLDLPGGGGIDAARRISDDRPESATRIVLLMSAQTDEAVFSALRAGATGLLLMDSEPDEFVAAVRTVARGEALLTPALASRLVADFVARPERLRCTREELEELTAREREVVALVASGLSNVEIAEQLVVTRATAKTHVSGAIGKLRARDRAQLVVLAYETGLIRPARPVPPTPVSLPVDRYARTDRLRRPALTRIAA